MGFSVKGFCLVLVVLAAAIALGWFMMNRDDDEIIFEQTSGMWDVVVTSDSQGIRQLRFGRKDVRQSQGKIDEPNYIGLPVHRAMIQTPAFLPAAPSRILVLGMGGGVLPAFMRYHYPQAPIDVVEMDPVVVHVAQTYFNFRADNTTVAYVSEGREFLEKHGARLAATYDYVMQDACPQPLCAITTVEGLRIIHSMMKPGAVFVHNTWKYQPRCVRAVQEVFSHVYLLETRASNRVLIGIKALPGQQRITEEQFAHATRNLFLYENFPHDGSTYANRNEFVDLTVPRLTAEPFRDVDLPPAKKTAV